MNQPDPEGKTEYLLNGGKGQCSEIAASNHRKELSVMFSNDDGERDQNLPLLPKITKDYHIPKCLRQTLESYGLPHGKEN